MDDTLAWHYDIKGIFSVRSAYKVHTPQSRTATVSAKNEARGLGKQQGKRRVLEETMES